MLQQQGFHAQPGQHAQGDQARIGEPHDPGHLREGRYGGMNGCGRDIPDRDPPWPRCPAGTVLVLAWRQERTIRSPPGWLRGHRPFARVEAVDLRTDRYRPAARDDPAHGFFLPEGVGWLWLARYGCPMATEADRAAERFAMPARIEPVGAGQHLLECFRGPRGRVARWTGRCRAGRCLAGRRPPRRRVAPRLDPGRGSAGRSWPGAASLRAWNAAGGLRPRRSVAGGSALAGLLALGPRRHRSPLAVTSTSG